MTVVPYTPRAELLPARPGSLEVLERVGELAEIVANTEFVPRGLRGNQAAIAAAILYGHEVGLEPMQSLSSIAIIDGRPTMAAEAMRGLILSRGHEIWPEEATNTRVVMAGRRSDSKQTVRVTWTLDDAKRARLAGKPNWQAYPRQMLLARATAELARSIFADVIRGMAATEEAADLDEGAAALASAPEPETPPTRRRRRPMAASASPPPEPEPGAEPSRTEEPALPAESPAPSEETAEPDPPSRETVGKMFALFTEKGFTERDERLAYTQAVLEREIQSSTELSQLDAGRVIEALEALPDQLPAREQAILDDLETELDARVVEEQAPAEPPPEEPAGPIAGQTEIAPLPPLPRQLDSITALTSARQLGDPIGVASQIIGRQLARLEELTRDEATNVLNRLTRPGTI